MHHPENASNESAPLVELLERRLLLSGVVGDYTACWMFDEGLGAIAQDESPSGYDAAISGASWTSDEDGTALSFDNLDDYVDNDANNLIAEISTHSQGSISVWFRINTFPSGGAVHSVFYLGDGGGASTDSFHVEVGHFNDSQQRRLYFTLIKGGSVRMCYDSSGYMLLDTDTWYHFVGIVGADYNTGYLNGSEMVGRGYNVGTTGSDHYWFADLSNPTFCYTGEGVLGRQSHWNYFDGVIDEPRLYDRPLNASEVTQLFQGSGPVAPAVTSTARGGEGDQLSSLSFTFSKDVASSIDAGDLTLYNQTTGTPVDMTGVGVSYDAPSDTGTWDLSMLPLTPGYYTATLVSTGITDDIGKQLDGDGVGGGDYVMQDVLVALGGDADMNGAVNVGDLGILAGNYGTDDGSADWSTGDFNHDGDVNVGDLGILAANYGLSVGGAGGGVMGSSGFAASEVSAEQARVEHIIGSDGEAMGAESATAEPQVFADPIFTSKNILSSASEVSVRETPVRTIVSDSPLRTLPAGDVDPGSALVDLLALLSPETV